MRILRFVETMVQDLRYGARLLRRSPAFALVSVTSLAVGLGAGAALFTALNAVIFRPLPGRGTGDILSVTTSTSRGGPGGSSSYPDFESYVTAASDLVAGSCASARARGNMTVRGAAQAVAGAIVSGGCFELLGVPATIGRTISRADERTDTAPPPIVISHALWHRMFGGDAAAVGQDVLLNGVSASIVGIAPPGFAGTSLDSGADFWVAPPLGAALLPPGAIARGSRMFRVYVRLREGVAPAQLSARLDVIAGQLRAADPPAWTDSRGAARRVFVLPEIEARFAETPGGAASIAMPALGVIAAIVALACANLATIMLARGASRTREINVRLALGASRGRLLRQLATESILVAAAGTIVGIAGVAGALRVLNAYRPVELPAFNIAVDWRVIGFGAAAALLTSLFFGLAPGAYTVKLAIAEGLKGRAAVIRRRWLRLGAREVLLFVQVAVSFAAITVAAVFAHALGVDARNDRSASMDGVVLVPVDLEAAVASNSQVLTRATELLRAAERAPGTSAVTAAAVVPMTGSTAHFSGEAIDVPGATVLSFDGNVVAPGYFQLTGVRFRQGRDFTDADRDGSTQVAIVSEGLARRMWGSADVIGRSIRMDKSVVQVVGVVEDVMYRTSGERFPPMVYRPLAQQPRRRFFLQARLHGSGEMAAALDRELRAVDPRIVIAPPMSMRQLMDQVKAPTRIAQYVGTAGGLLQLGLALMALWGLVAYAVARRTSEIGIRLALGASHRSILGLVMRPTLTILFAGVAVGWGAGVAIATTLRSELDGLSSMEPSASVWTVVLCVLVAATAAWIPARRAIALQPSAALRAE